MGAEERSGIRSGPVSKRIGAPEERTAERSPEQISKAQRARLQGALLEAVSRHGYGETTVRELVALAGVSKTTFYNHFEGKRECFLATFEAVIEEFGRRLIEAYQRPGDFRAKMLATLREFMSLAAEDPAAASLIAVDVLSLGAPGVARREQASERFEALVERALAQAPNPERMPPHTPRALVAGIRAIAYWHLRAGTEAELPGLVEPLIEWALSYQGVEGELTRRAAAAAAEPAPPAPPRAAEALPGWEEPPDSPVSRRRLSQRQRIVRAAGRVVFERGYEGLSIPAISAAAGVSNQTFYEHFASKRDAFLAAFDELVGETLETVASTFAAAGDRPEAVGIGLRSLLEHIAANEVVGKVAVLELPVAGAQALDRGDAVIDSFTAFLAPGTVPSQFTHTVPEVVREAIGGGIFGVIQHEIVSGRLAELPDLAPELTRLALMPLDPG